MIYNNSIETNDLAFCYKENEKIFIFFIFYCFIYLHVIHVEEKFLFLLFFTAFNRIKNPIKGPIFYFLLEEFCLAFPMNVSLNYVGNFAIISISLILFLLILDLYEEIRLYWYVALCCLSVVLDLYLVELFAGKKKTIERIKSRMLFLLMICLYTIAKTILEEF